MFTMAHFRSSSWLGSYTMLSPYGRSRRPPKNVDGARTKRAVSEPGARRRRLRYDPYFRIQIVGFTVTGDGCHIFNQRPNKSTGYCQVPNAPGSTSGQPLLVHRVVYEHHHGPIEPGLVIDHVCHNDAVANGSCTGSTCIHRACMNIAHLRAVTHRENIMASPLTNLGRRRSRLEGADAN